MEDSGTTCTADAAWWWQGSATESGATTTTEKGIDGNVKDKQKGFEDIQESRAILLQEIQDSKLDFVTIKTELKHLVENVKELSTIVRDGDGSGSIITRLALLEQSINDTKEYINKDTIADAAISTRLALSEQRINDLQKTFDDIKKKEIAHKNKKLSETAADKEGKWKLYAIIAGGVITLLGSVITLLIGLLSN